MKGKNIAFIRNTLVVLFLACAAWIWWLSGAKAAVEPIAVSSSSSVPVPSSESIAVEEPPPLTPEVEEYSYPTDQLFVTNQRQQYQDGELRLVVPALSLDVPVINGVTEKALEQGPGLYDYAQLPSWGNPNVSIAGHRDIHGSPFYFIDKLTQGDYIYLIYQNIVYLYQYKETRIIEANDWSPIYSAESSLVTLTSCDPIGTSWKRIIVTGELKEVADAENYEFLPCTPDTQRTEIWPRFQK